MTKKDFGLTFKKINIALERKFNISLKEYDLTVPQAHILGYLYYHGGKAKMSEIETHLNVSHPTVTGLFKRLEQKGFIKTELNTVGRIYKTASLTKLGETMVDGFKNGHIEAESVITNGFSKEEIKKLEYYLCRVLDNLSEYLPNDFVCKVNKDA
ncbi:MAG: MarR family winged helix-turn-helix transcriptional regulator [Candidatus Fimenecus sp.]